MKLWKQANKVHPKVNYPKLERIGRELITALGYDVRKANLRDTPRRWASWWRDFINYDPGKVGTVFPANHADQMVVISGMRVWSLCEHHLLPFYCDISIGYIPQGKVLGLSKFARIAHRRASSLQIQERLVREIADDVMPFAQTKSVAVMARGEHLCMTMRGIKTRGLMTSSVMEGDFRNEPQARAEFLSLIQKELK